MARRFKWAAGEKEDPNLKSLRNEIRQIQKLAAYSGKYLKDGAYAPLGGMLLYLRKDINNAMKSIRQLTRAYSR